MRYLYLIAVSLISGLLLVSCTNTTYNKTYIANKPLDLLSFTAFGNKNQSWRAVVKGNKLSIDADFFSLEVLVVVSSSMLNQGISYSGTLNGQSILLNIEKKTCIEDDGHENEFTAKLSYSGKIYSGCAVSGAIDVAPT